MKNICTTLLTTAAILLAAAAPATAGNIAQENFTYSDGNLDTLNGGSGWAGAWADDGDARGDFVVESNQAIYKGDGTNQTITFADRSLASAVTVGTLDTLTIEFDLILNEIQAGRGIAVNLMNAGNIVLTIGKRINDDVAIFDSGIGASSIPVTTPDLPRASATLTTTLTYDGADTLLSLTDGTNVSTGTISGQLTIDAVQLTGYHRLTVSNGVDDFSMDLVTIPEPSTVALFGMTVFGFAAIRRRR